MSDFRQAADALKAKANGYKAIIEAADFLASIADIEQHRRELEAAVAKLGTDREAARQALAAVHQQVADTERELVARTAQAAEVTATATTQAGAIIRAADADAETILERARATAKGIVDGAANARVTLAGLEAEIATTRQELTLVQADLAAVRAQAARLAGG
jgi:chromosome segregation ATPase